MPVGGSFDTDEVVYHIICCFIYSAQLQLVDIIYEIYGANCERLLKAYGCLRNSYIILECG